jgi:hypothetical protein
VAIGALVVALIGAAGVGAFRTTPGDLLDQRVEGAARVRWAARAACDAGRSRDCLALYDEARRLDPAGDKNPMIAEDRIAALAALAQESGSPALPQSDSASGPEP